MSAQEHPPDSTAALMMRGIFQEVTNRSTTRPRALSGGGVQEGRTRAMEHGGHDRGPSRRPHGRETAGTVHHPHDTTELLRWATAGSVDDGKSTLVGRLLHDSMPWRWVGPVSMPRVAR